MAIKVPFRPKLFNRPRKPYKYIILHDINCQFGEDEENFIIDTKRIQLPDLRSRYYLFTGEPELPYHNLAEFVGKDYETFMCRPLSLMCDYEDIISPHNLAIHIGMMGSFTHTFPDNRFYKQLAYRAVSSLMKLYRISFNQVFLHHEISQDDDCNCPGEFFDKNSFVSQLKPMLAVQR